MASDAMTMGENKNGRMFLYAGIVLGMVAAVMVAITLTNASTNKGTSAEGTTKLAVVATQDIPARTRITVDMLKVGVFKLDEVDPESFGRVSEVINRVTSADIPAGQVLTPLKVSETSGSGLSFTVSPGMRGVSIEVEEVIAAGGNISPGNYVDVIGVFKLSDKADDIAGIASALTGNELVLSPIIAGKVSMTVTLLQNVRVLAVDQSVYQAQPDETAEKAATKPRASTVTLEVVPDKAQLLAMADNLGTLRLSLRPFGEDIKVPVAPIVLGIEDN